MEPSGDPALDERGGGVSGAGRDDRPAADRVRPLLAGLELPAIVAPMFLVSCPALVIATCAEGLVGSFPAHSTRTRAVFRDWLDEIEGALAALRAAEPDANIAPYAVNLVTHRTNERMQGDLELCIAYRVPIVLTSKGAPTDAVARIHDYGGIVLHDVASRRHAEKAIEGGVDGLIVVAQGAGGHTGTINPFALMNEIRAFYDGPIALAGCISTGRNILAARAMGADGVYVGTRFIATRESLAPEAHKRMILSEGAGDVFLTAALDGAPANFLTRSLVEAGIDLDALHTAPAGAIVAPPDGSRRWRDIWSAGQGVGAICEIASARAVARQLKAEYRAATRDFMAAMAPSRER
jgi:nitronate monooxygenase